VFFTISLLTLDVLLDHPQVLGPDLFYWEPLCDMKHFSALIY